MKSISQSSRLSKSLFLFVPVLIFLAVISVNYFKPFGFFRESNPAMVCINAIMWNRHPALEKQHVPISSYAFDAAAQPSTQLYNTIVSFGNGWFSLPYYFFKTFSLSPNEHSIRLFSLFWLVITLSTIFLLARQVANGKENGFVIVYFTLIFYVFNAATLWYHVEGYLHEIAVLPFYFAGWWLFSRYLKMPSPSLLFAIVLTLFVGIQFDWLPFFQAMVMSAYLLFSKKKLTNGLFYCREWPWLRAFFISFTTMCNGRGCLHMPIICRKNF